MTSLNSQTLCEIENEADLNLKAKSYLKFVEKNCKTSVYSINGHANIVSIIGHELSTFFTIFGHFQLHVNHK